jgi:hypothetical protein
MMIHETLENLDASSSPKLAVVGLMNDDLKKITLMNQKRNSLRLEIHFYF